MKPVSLLLLLAFLAACRPEQPPSGTGQAKDSLSVPADIGVVVGIGKVEPEGGIVELASEAGGIVQSVDCRVGDTLRQGDIIISLKSEDAALRVQQLKDQLATQGQQVEADQIAVGQYQAQLQHNAQTLATSKHLVKSGAETRQQVEALETDKKVLEVQLARSRKTVAVSRAKADELRSQLKTAENTLREKTVTAPSDGVLLSMDAKAGGAVQPLESFAAFAPAGPMVVQGEADEMFANRLTKSQKVSIRYIGNTRVITTGVITALSPQLSNKSLFTDVPGERQDRRVRRFKVLLDSTDHLLINTKVECNIYIQHPEP